MSTKNGNLRQRKAAMTNDGDEESSKSERTVPPPGVSFGTMGRRRRRIHPRNGEDMYRSWITAVAAISIWFLVLTRWSSTRGIIVESRGGADTNTNLSAGVGAGADDIVSSSRNFHKNRLRRKKLKGAGGAKLPSIDAIAPANKEWASGSGKAHPSARQEDIHVNASDRVEFLCADRKGKGFLNDDYCDCADGSDEPRTSACSHLLVRKKTFKCADGHSFIYPSRIRDGVKDCPDGSDEWIS